MQYFGIALLIKSKVVECIGSALHMMSIFCAMHWDSIAYDKHCCAMQ